jgi:3-deoxy-manno-octulosonate cytidylyltransferase (CMP-KDO synthetase)
LKKGVIVIPARMRATRFPGKPLADLGGVPLVIRVAQRAATARLSVPIWIASEDDCIGQAARAYGFYWCKTPATATGTDKLAWLAQQHEYDWWINLQGDEPFIASEDIRRLASMLSEPKHAAYSLWRKAYSVEDWQNPHHVKVVLNIHNQALYFSRAPIPAQKTPASSTVSSGWHRAKIHIGIYGYTGSFLRQWHQLPPSELEKSEGLEQLRLLDAGFSMGMTQGFSASLGIDSLADWAQAYTYWMNHQDRYAYQTT